MDNRAQKLELKTKQIARLCHRRFGIGADGLMLLQNRKGFDFEMIYYNSDGRASSFCGNGSRCLVAFAKKLNVMKKSEVQFIASDGIHTAKINGNNVSVKMRDVKNIEIGRDYYVLDTGSPHYVKFLNGVQKANIIAQGKNIRYSSRFKKEGINVNLAEKKGKNVF